MSSSSHVSKGRSPAGWCLFDRQIADRSSVLWPMRRSTSRSPSSTVAQTTNTIRGLIRLAARGEEATFARKRSSLFRATSALSVSSPQGGGTLLFLLVESSIAARGAAGPQATDRWAPTQKRSRRSRFMTFPVGFLGKSTSENSTYRGTLKFARLCLQ